MGTVVTDDFCYRIMLTLNKLYNTLLKSMYMVQGTGFKFKII